MMVSTKVTLTLLVLRTHHLDAVRDFYSAFGVAFVEEQHGKGPVHFAARVGSLVLEIYPLSDAKAVADSSTRLGFTVERLAELVEALRRDGTAIVSEPRQTEWGLRAVVRDPDGRAVELSQS